MTRENVALLYSPQCSGEVYIVLRILFTYWTGIVIRSDVILFVDFFNDSSTRIWFQRVSVFIL